MPNPRIEPWLSKEDYHAFKKLAPDDPALPESFDDWHEAANEMVSVFVKSGVPVETIHITPDEFERFCTASGINPDGVARAAFAVSKKRKK